MTRHFKGTISIGLAGANREFEFEMPDDATDEEIEQVAADEVYNVVEWNFQEAGAD